MKTHVRISALLVIAFLSAAMPASAIRPLDSDRCSRVLVPAPEGFHETVNEQTPMGPRLVFQSVGEKRPIEEIVNLKIGSYNVENLFIRSSGMSNRRNQFKLPTRKGGETELKPEAKIKAVGDVIMRENPDVMVAVEVDDIRALKYLADTYLDQKYFAVLIEGNDSRGIDIGFLVKKDLPFDLEVQSNKNAKPSTEKIAGPNDPVFSRDLPVLKLRLTGSKESDNPFLVVAGTHYKSMAGNNPVESVAKRAQQAKRTAEILSEFDAKGVPYMLMGDYNNHVPAAAEFKALFDQGMKDVFDIVVPPVIGNDRVTQTFHPANGNFVWNQLDAILISKEAQGLQNIENAHVVQYLDANGNVMPLPETYAQRELQPSDHRMISATFTFAPFRKK